MSNTRGFLSELYFTLIVRNACVVYWVDGKIVNLNLDLYSKCYGTCMFQFNHFNGVQW